ncbi:MAG TPA: hypothetical protein PK668_10570 [Myxococcota bacterium]|nr:hypothetical protein [Myxococcota bacterium]HRY93394.1 hypothetical protein [Myxococcota bacterium]HSA20382.1 hypothetical protein [Myxococcota bacterium]
MKKLGLILAVLLASQLGGCFWWDENYDDDRCLDPSRYPACTPDGHAYAECVDGVAVEFECGWEELCVQGEDPRGRWTVCLPEGEELCDPADQEASCHGEAAVRVCLSGGVTRTYECGDEDVCLVGPLGAVCVRPGSVPCDPEDGAQVCHEGVRASCSPQTGFLTLAEACEEGLTCRLGASGAVCAEPDALECDYLSFHSSCTDESTYLGCSAMNGFTQHWDCAVGWRCRQGPSVAGCFPPDQPDCDPATFMARCEGPDRRVCGNYGVEETLTCPFELPCQEGAYGPVCVDPEAEACNPALFEPVCDGADQVLCASGSGFTTRLTCSAGEICVPDAGPWSFTGLTCVDPGSPTCDRPGEFWCEVDRAVICSGGYRQEAMCDPGRVCVADAELYLCLPADSPTCDVASYSPHCEDNAAHTCFGGPGREIIWPCGDAATCAVLPDGTLTCQPI